MRGSGAGKAAVPRRQPPPPAIAPFDYKQAKAHQAAWAKYLGVPVEQTNSIGMKLALIPPGECSMGSTPEQIEAARKMAEEAKVKPGHWIWSTFEEETPQHRVVITKPCLLGATEVTIGQFKKFVSATGYVSQGEQFGFGSSHLSKADDTITPQQRSRTWRAPGYSVTDENPVTQVTWNDAIQFCNWLSGQEKLAPCYRNDTKYGWIPVGAAAGYRLPSEAEWEHGCRAGTITQFSFGDDPTPFDNYGWFNKNSGTGVSPHRVGLKLPNAFGLFDMHGNAAEWCQDRYVGDFYRKSPLEDPIATNELSQTSVRPMRGGTAETSAAGCRSALRYRDTLMHRLGTYGFRVMRVGTSASAAAPPLPAKPISTRNDPAFQQWLKTVTALAAEKQVEAVAKKLMEINPGFDGKLTDFEGIGQPKIQNGIVVRLEFVSDKVTDISPLIALKGLQVVICHGSEARKGAVADLSPLHGMSLVYFSCSCSQASDLSPLKGMPLSNLGCQHSRVSDLSPLKGLTLARLTCGNTLVSDLSALAGMPLTHLDCRSTEVSDLSPLHSCKSLAQLTIVATKVTPATVAALQKALPNCQIEWDDPTKAKTAAPEPAR